MKPTGKISVLEKFSYGLGDTASNLFYQTFTLFLLYFYTDVFGISAAAAGTMFLVVRMLDTFYDPVVGILADRTKSKFGKFRPWILYTVIPFGVAGFLMFYTPELATSAKLVYAYITYTAMMFIYSTINVPYGALMAVMTPNSLERTSLAAYRSIMAFTGGLIVQSLTPSLVKYFGLLQPLADGKVNEQFGYSFTMAIYSVLAVIMFLVTFFFCKERVQPVNEQSSSLKNDFKGLLRPLLKFIFKVAAIVICLYLIDYLGLSKFFQKQFSNFPTVLIYAALFVLIFWLISFFSKKPTKTEKDDSNSLKNDFMDLVSNRPWLILTIVGIMTCLYVAVRNSAIMYYFKYYANGRGTANLFGFHVSPEALVSTFMVVGTAFSIIGTILLKPAAAMFGKKNVYLWAMILATVFSIVYYFLGKDQISLMFLFQALSNLMVGPAMAMMWSMYADTADYSEWKTGRRATGLIYSSANFAQKFGWSIGGAIGGYLLAYYGFEANAPATANTEQGIKVLFGFMPAIWSAIGAIALIFYKLDEKKVKDINDDLERMKAENVSRPTE